MLSSPDHQIVYGRRGTGKTHALRYLADEVHKRGELAIFIDMRTIGSSGGVYGDSSLPIHERGGRLLLDTIGVVQDALATRALELHDDVGDFTQALRLVDELAEEITNSVKVVGTTSAEQSSSSTSTSTSGSKASIELGSTPSANLGITSEDSATAAGEQRVRREGVEQHSVHFGAVSGLMDRLITALGLERVWVLIDEWSATPLDLQPLLADLFRRSLFPLQKVTVKIAAIEQRSEFQAPSASGGQLGIEVGADAAADIHLDDFMVFGNDAEKAKGFFQNLLFKHVVAALSEDGRESEAPTTPQQMVQRGFTQRNAFDEFVKAAEGVPRDAINILAIAAQRAIDEPISVPHIRSAARAWYQRDKEAALSEEARQLLVWIIAEVIGDRQARAFMLEQGEDRRNSLVRSLYDGRVLHLLKRGIAAQDSERAGVRFNGWGLDYGCYVDLINTVKAPRGLFEVHSDDDDDASFVEVPSDDYRSIRKAILDLGAFERRPAKLPIDD